MKTNIEGGFLVSDKKGVGIPLLFIHGYPLSRRIWDPQVVALSDYATLITIDLRGHGDSFEFDGAYPMELLADDCKMVLEDQKINQPAIICGLSMGGYVTMALYRKYPELFKGMILTSTRAGADSPESKANRDASIKVAQERGVSTIAENMVQKMFAPATLPSNPGLIKRIYHIMATTSQLGVVGALQGMRERPDSSSLIPNIKCPVLIIHGVDDQLIPVTEAELIHHLLPESQLIKIEKAGHLLNLEQPAEYNQAVSDFINQLN